MRFISRPVVFVSLTVIGAIMLAFIGACDDPVRRRPGGPPDPDPAETLPAVVSSPEPFALSFSMAYLPRVDESGDLPECAEVRGDLPGLGWEDGTGWPIYDEDGDFTLDFYMSTKTSGCYRLTLYVPTWCEPSLPANRRWLQYGAEDILLQLSDEALEWLECNWWDEFAEDYVDPPRGEDPACGIAIWVDDDGTVWPDGNMGYYF